MRGLWIACICAVVAATASIGAGAAEAAVDLGSAVQPPGSTPSACIDDAVFTQKTTDPSVSFVVPAGGGGLTGWALNTVEATPGTSVTLLALRSAGEGSFEVVGADTETLPEPLPADGVASFTLAHPIALAGGDTFGLFSGESLGAACFFQGGATPEEDVLTALPVTAPPAVGQTLAPITASDSPPAYRLNLAVRIQPGVDPGVTATAGPAGATVGALAVLGSTVTNHGPVAATITFTDTVPPGLGIDSAVAGSGTCSTAGRTVTCTIEGLAPGESAPVNVLVTPAAAGSYANTVSVAPPAGLTDPTPADAHATATLRVAAAPGTAVIPGRPTRPPRRACVVPNLRRVGLATARRLLRPLGCRPGKVRRVHDRKIARGKLIRTTPRRGTYAAGRRVELVVSAGAPRHHHHHRARHRIRA